jgi:hypothetical protein
MKRIFLAATLTLGFTATAALASSGKTADGCTYKVINGQYLTSCDPTPQAASDQVVVASAAPAVVASAPVTSYGAVPMRANPDALVPSVQTVAPQTMTVSLSTAVQSSLVIEEAVEPQESFKDYTYVGANLSSTSIKEGGSSTGLGATIGANLDEYFGVELGYNYTSQGLNLGLDTRGNTLGDTYPAREDSALKSHLITAEFQGYATNSNRRFRPYLGLGMGVKLSSLKEKTLGSGNNYGYYGNETPTGTLSQTSFGGIGSAGAKVRVGKAFQVGVAFRYFFPLLRQESSLRQQRSTYGEYASAQTRLTKADEALTGASQYQLQGGLEYSF